MEPKKMTTLRQVLFNNDIKKERVRSQDEERFNELMSQRLKIWTECLNEARQELPQASEEDLILLADRKSIERWNVPPHWRKWVICHDCGPVPIPGGFSKQDDLKHIQACPWCFTGAGGFYRENPEMRFWDVPKLKDAI